MNSVVEKKDGALSAVAGLKAGLANVRQSVRVASSDPFLRLLQDGDWVFGADDEEVEEGSLWAADPRSIEHGVVCWTDHDQTKKKVANEIVGEVMVPMSQPVPLESAQEDKGWPWKQQLAITIVCVKGAQAGKQTLYKATSEGGKRAIKELVGAIMAQLDVDPGKPVPVFELGVNSYKHKVYGKTYVPVFELQSWEALDATELSEDTSEDDETATEGAAEADTGETVAEGAEDSNAPFETDEDGAETAAETGEADPPAERSTRTRRKRR